MANCYVCSIVSGFLPGSQEMNTDNYRAWQALLLDRDQGIYILFFLAAFLVGSYLITYVNWIPQKYGRKIRAAYEIGGILLYVGLIYICL